MVGHICCMPPAMSTSVVCKVIECLALHVADERGTTCCKWGGSSNWNVELAPISLCAIVFCVSKCYFWDPGVLAQTFPRIPAHEHHFSLVQSQTRCAGWVQVLWLLCLQKDMKPQCFELCNYFLGVLLKWPLFRVTTQGCKGFTSKSFLVALKQQRRSGLKLLPSRAFSLKPLD